MNEPRPEFVVVVDESKFDIPAFGVRTAEGTPHDAKVAEALAELQTQAAFFKVLGSYPHAA